jgi:hypothetical protein
MRTASAKTYPLAWSESRTTSVVPAMEYGPPRSSHVAPASAKSPGPASWSTRTVASAVAPSRTVNGASVARLACGLQVAETR